MLCRYSVLIHPVHAGRLTSGLMKLVRMNLSMLLCVPVLHVTVWTSTCPH